MLLARPRGVLRYSALLAIHDIPALRPYHQAGRQSPISRNVTSVQFGAPPWGCTNPVCSRVLVHRGAPDAGLATSCECYRGSIARFRELPASLGEAARLAALVF